MLKGRGRDQRAAATMPPHLARQFAPTHTQAPAHIAQAVHLQTRPPTTQPTRAPLAKPEPDYEVVEFPTDQYVNAKLQPPPPPPPRPPTGHPAEATSCGLCGGGGARVRCSECGRRALCASCDDMYHRHPKRRHHQRQALSPGQLRDVRPPLPPKATPPAPVPPPRRHKLSGDRSSASPRPSGLEQRRATIGHLSTLPNQSQMHYPGQLQPQVAHNNHAQIQNTLPVQNKLTPPTMQHMGSMPYLANSMQHAPTVMTQPTIQANTLAAWGHHRGSLQGFNVHPAMGMPSEAWESPESVSSVGGATTMWGRPLRRGASVLDVGGGAAASAAGCVACVTPPAWRYASCASLEHAWPAYPSQPHCCSPHHHSTHVPHAHYTPQPHRKAESRLASRAGSRAGSRCASPSPSVRSRASRRTKPRSPTPSLPSSDADSESDGHAPPPTRRAPRVRTISDTAHRQILPPMPTSPPPAASASAEPEDEPSPGPPPPAPSAAWQCEHCTFVNEPGVRVCAVCCRTPTAAPRVLDDVTASTAAATDHLTRLRLDDRPVDNTRRQLARNEREPSLARDSTPARGSKEKASMACGTSPPRTIKEKSSTACGPSPPRDIRSRTSTGCGPSPPKETRGRTSTGCGPSPPREVKSPVKQSPAGRVLCASISTSPGRDAGVGREPGLSASGSARTVANTGTSPPPQSISTQTYAGVAEVEREREWEREREGAECGSRWRGRSARRRDRTDTRRPRSRSRHSLSSDTRESERSVQTAGGRWEWRSQRDSSPTADWSGPERLARRASHLDLRHVRAPTLRRYGSQTASPERAAPHRTLSMEALGDGRGLELARLMEEAEQLGFSAAEVHAALAQSPTAPLTWLRERWPSLCAGVQAAASRLAGGGLAVPEGAARAALARHRGAMWPAVTDCVGRLRAAHSGRVWGSPAGADDDAPAPPPPRARAEDSSDEFDPPPPVEYEDDDWKYLPLDRPPPEAYPFDRTYRTEPQPPPPRDAAALCAEDIALALKTLLVQAGVPPIDKNLLLKGLLAETDKLKNETVISSDMNGRPQSTDFIQSENDFIDAYNALARTSPLPVIINTNRGITNNTTNPEVNVQDSTNNEKKVSRDDDAGDAEVTFVLNIRQPSTSSEVEDHSEIPDIINNNEIINDNQDDFQVQDPVKDIKNQETTNSSSAVDEPNKTATEETPGNLADNNATFKMLTNNSQTLENSTNFKLNNSASNKDQQQKNKINKNQSIVDENAPSEHIELKQNNDEKIVSSTNKVMISKKTNEYYAKTSSTDKDKYSNLNDIFGDTQKLIKQMKEEINSDINSLDGHMSQSEADNSSNESDYSSEHESSYRDSADTDLTSDEHEGSSTEQDENNKESRKGSIVLNRTSSEENDQFEEAMDHIEEQNESFKQTNIEILDSIARSLQEDHIITFEGHNDLPTTNHKTDQSNVFILQTSNSFTIPVQKKNDEETERTPTIAATDKQPSTGDINNNLFTKVNSFEEIYEEIAGTSNTRTSKSKKDEKIETQMSKLSKKPFQEIITPTEQVKNNIPVLNLQKFPIVKSVFNADIPNTVILTEIQHQSINAIRDSSLPDAPVIIPHDLVKNNSYPNGNSHEDNNTNLSDDNNTDESTNSSKSSRKTISPVKTTPILNVELKKETTDQMSRTELEYTDGTLSNSVITNTNNESASNSNVEMNISTEKPHFKDKNESPEKVLPINETKSNIANKSQIPKLVKTATNNKQKFERNGMKVVVSKVPVRRGSIKKIPAPAPPKSHFGNVQYGHVKQLQTKLFNSKSQKPSGNSASEAVPSTSFTMNKKKPAPLPPSQNNKSMSPPESPPKEVKPFFRETCRTEDEWTESDSEDKPFSTDRQNSEELIRAPSPLPPVTMRRVSGQLVDLATIRLLEGSPERQARMLLAEGALENWSQAQLAVELVARGAEPSAALLAALECVDLNSALAYLHQECELCASRLPEHEMVSMLRCTHRCCRECARHYFTVQITERSIADCVCPYCKEPELENLPEDAWLEYFAHLDILLKTLLDEDVHELFQRKLRDRTLARDPNFRWCVECSSGFFVHPKQKKLRCPECKSVSCASCRKPWSSNHEGLSCEQYTAWLEDNDPEKSVAAVQQHLRENGLDCPRCHFKYSLSRGGCMHFTCTQCKYEFCYGCGKPFMMGARCGLSEYCARLGLHAHHPRNCLFYLRDKEPHELQTLLQMHNVPYETAAPEGSTNRCPIQLQKETPTGLVDAACGSEVPPNHAGLCKPHYVEYLAGLARPRRLDPIPIMELSELVAELRRRALALPERGPWDSDPVYAGMCAEIVKEKIPLE